MQAGDAANARGQLSQALAAYEKAVKAAEAMPDRPEWLIRGLLKYGDLTERAGNEGRDAQAGAIFTRALAVAEKAYGKDDPRLVEPLTTLGWSLWRQQKYPEAEARMIAALAISEKALPADATQLADARFTLGGFHLNLQAHEKAAGYYRQALPVYEKAYGPEHQRTRYTRLSLGRCLTQARQYTEALAQLQPLVDVLARTKPGGWEHSEALSALAAVYIAQQQYDKAEPLELQVYTHAEKLIGADNMGMTNYQTCMAQFYQDAGQAEKAEPYLQRVIVLMSKPNVPKAAQANAHVNYGMLLMKLKRPADARKAYQAAHDLYESWLAEVCRKHTDTGELLIPKFFHDQVPECLAFLTRYATFLREQHEEADAFKLTVRAAQVKEIFTRSKLVYANR
jgi:tetratricopeptide (TPR) repeat protein